MEVLIEPLTLGDAKEAAALEALSFGSVGWTRQDFEETLSLDYAYYLGAWRGKELIGAAGARLIAGDAYISNVSVCPEERRQGIASKLMEGLINLLKEKGAEAYTLEVRSKNAAAVGLYKKYGFVTEGFRRNFYTDPVDDALIMWRR